MSLLALVLVFFTPSWAQILPNAGSIRQQLEHDLQGPAQRLQIKPPVKGVVESPAGGQTVSVQAFKFKGNTLLSNEQLSAALVSLIGRPLDFARLQSSAVIVADLYRDKGWVVQTFLPEQDIANAEVTIVIVEAVFGQIQMTGTPPVRVASEDVLAIFSRQQQAGQFLNMTALDRALLLADDLPGVTVSGNLLQGQMGGQTNLLLQIADEPMLLGSIQADNVGAVSTGSDRSLVSLHLNSPAGQGDALSLNVISTLGSRYGRLGYTLPLGFDGWRVGVNASRLEYELITEPYKTQSQMGKPTEGNATTAGVELSYPVVRNRSINLLTNLNIDQKKYFNVSGGATTSAYRSVPVSVALSGSSFDVWGGGGANAFSWTMTGGNLNLNGSPTQQSDAKSTQTAGAFNKVRYAISRQQQVIPSMSILTAFSGQWANKNLESSEKFYLGGSGGVRAYPSSEGGSSLGQLLNVELRLQLPDGFNLAGFYDYGRLAESATSESSVQNAYALKGAGLTLGWRHASGLALMATYARRIGNNPNPITTDVNLGADQDGTLQRNRLWLSASVTF